MNLHVFTTDRGTPYSLAMAPGVKVSTLPELAERWPDLIDVDAGHIATARSSVEELGSELSTTTSRWPAGIRPTPRAPDPHRSGTLLEQLYRRECSKQAASCLPAALLRVV
jgi:hypothetical protein